MTYLDPTRLDSFLAAYFAATSRMSLDALMSSNVPSARCIRDWLEGFRERGDRLLLPRQDGEESRWYLVANSEEHFRALQEETAAFISNSYAENNNRRLAPNPSDPIDSVLVDYFGARPPMIGISAGTSASAKARLCEVLQLMHDVHAASSVRPPILMRPTGRILRDFYMALQAGLRDAAESVLQELEDERRFDALNLQFLRIRLYATFHEWRTILSMPLLGDILHSRRPHAVTGALAKAIYRSFIVPIEQTGSPAAVRECFLERVWPQYGELFKHWAGQTDPDVVKAFMLAAVSCTPPRLHLRDELLGLDIDLSLIHI